MEKGAADKSNTFTSNFLIMPTLLCYQSKSVHTWKKKNSIPSLLAALQQSHLYKTRPLVVRLY